MRATLLLLFILSWFNFSIVGMAQTYAIIGEVRDANTQEALPSCNIQRANGKVITTDVNGTFKFTTSLTQERLTVSFIGYQKQIVMIDPVKDTVLTVLLQPETKTLDEVRITDNRMPSEEQFESIRPGKEVLRKEEIMQLPGLVGEPDFLKALTLMPGTTRGIEGSSDIFIRGGDADQNLVTLDGATVYNTGHLFGFLSVFNPSAVGEVSMMKGGFPAEFGGRLSSIIDVSSKKINKQNVQGDGAIGLLSSRLAIEVPIVKDKLAVQIAGRRTYADQVAQLANVELPYYFYDINANMDWKLSPNSHVHYGFYLGDDKLDFIRPDDDDDDDSGTQFELGNFIHTLTFDHRFSERLQTETQLHYTQFDYDINSFFEDNFLNVVSDIKDFGIKQKFDISISENSSIHTGISAVSLPLSPTLLIPGASYLK